ncbi:Protein N-terminal asparagine amidohydrolase, partial [Trinorchestia longiramus]
MVLVIGDQVVKEVPSSTSGVYSTWCPLKDTAHALANIHVDTIGCLGLLYIRPREFAVTVPHDDAVHFLGTDDATTSVMAVLRHTG